MSDHGKKATDYDEVEQLLRAAHDDVLLKLNVNSHMARASASPAMDPDLDRRFQALKRPQKSTKVDDPAKIVAPKTNIGVNEVAGAAAEDDDLFARFAALKSSTPSHGERENTTSDLSGDIGASHEVKEEESDDEVEKVIRWAIDAARLDPSPPSDDDNSDKDTGTDTDDDDDGDEKNRRKVNKK